MKKIGIAFAVLLGLFTLAYIAFDRLGGNNPILVEIVDKTPPTLAGKTFKGIPQDKELGETFQYFETLLSLNPGKKIHTIYFQEPAGKLDTMEVFVGLDLPFAPVGMESKSFSESRYILATIKASKWVMPGPEKVKAKIEDFAKENNLTLTGLFIDKIISDKEVVVVAPIK
ncbi:hypothetical protein [Algoriphagus sp. A40]|uniref:hypothetical protein n=1 Tax=Algoriphagus sp. A40 TaxID=1945863 RepID=UPI00098534B7|nr:hypothetical protein [Algoriphagus sp. A40]OOG75197.1 hypothetical protein B0E43_09360 [Algoriphagus sp. A40]